MFLLFISLVSSLFLFDYGKGLPSAIISVSGGFVKAYFGTVKPLGQKLGATPATRVEESAVGVDITYYFALTWWNA